MKKYIYLGFLMLAVILVACQDELGVSEVKSGYPAKLKLNIEVPIVHEITNSRAVTERESEIEDLVLVMIETGSKRVEFVDLSNLLSSSNSTTNGGRTYTLSANYESETLSGTYNIYAIANQRSSFANISLDKNSAQTITETEIQNLIAKNSNHFLAVGASTSPMSGTLNAVTINEDETKELAIKLTRTVSHIEFTFTNGNWTTDEGKKVKANFTPQYYTVYNLPENGYMIGGKEGSLSTSYFTSARQSVEGTSFEFMMLENIQTAEKEPTDGWTYNDREAWTGTAGSSPDQKDFIYAPDNGTFVVVSGTYEDDSYVGEVSYTIHLGNFSEKDYSNFEVNRNEYHKYNVTVNGVKSITVEATNEKLTNGAEGELTKKEGVTFILDAHYETVLVEIPTTKVIMTETDSVKNFVKFRTPKGTSTVALSDIQDEDINWIQFAKPEGSYGSYTFPLYKKYTTIKGLIDDIKAKSETYYQEYDGYYYTVAFVDEFYYNDLPLDQFVNVDNRFFIFNPTPVYTSTDGNSIFNSDSGFQIWQRSIKTTYNLSSGMNAFGIETWDETGALEFGLTYEKNDELSGQSNLDGFTNTQNLITLKNNEALTEEILSKVGYIEGVEDNTRESHVWGTFNTSDGTVTNTPVSDAIQACLARNRDLDGSGTIDLVNDNGENELKWYIPALYQYFIIWLGEELLPGDTRLFPTADFNSDRFTAMGDKYPRLYTSSSNGKRTYWPDQGAAWAVIYEYEGAGNNQWMGNKQALRCCRNLFESEITAPSVPGVYDSENNVIVVSGIEYVRKNLVTDYLSKHTERSTENFLPYKLEVAPLVGTNLYNNIVSGLTIDGLNETADAYNESNQGDSNIKWRVPNQRELMLMIMLGVLPEAKTTYGGERLNYWCTTWFTQSTDSYKPYPFMYDLADYGKNNAVLTLPGDGATGTSVVRFVRDYTGEIEGLTSSSYDAAYGQGGTGAGVE